MEPQRQRQLHHLQRDVETHRDQVRERDDERGDFLPQPEQRGEARLDRGLEAQRTIIGTVVVPATLHVLGVLLARGLPNVGHQTEHAHL